MKRIRSLFFLAVCSACLLLTGMLAMPAYAQVIQHTQRAHPAPAFHHACDAMPAGFARCHAIQLVQAGSTTTSISGYTPSDLQAAYHLLPTSMGVGQTVAIIDAYDDPNAEADLATYRAQFGLPACNTTNSCFKKVNQGGGTHKYPRADASWAQEISLDLDMVSAICPSCHILLVEANSASFANLGTAVDTAVKHGATVASNSYGGTETSTGLTYASHYNHPGVIITASAGDNGYGIEMPAVYSTVVSVGGTSLTRDSSTARGWSETAWGGTGSGCSAYVSRPAWQTGSGCANRMVTDVSAVADPATGVAVYDSYGAGVGTGWMVFGGTSVASPIIASIYALAGNASHVNAAASLYSHTSDLNDVVSGSNGTCTPGVLCTAGPGYDGPTGLGTPNGLGAF